MGFMGFPCGYAVKNPDGTESVYAIPADTLYGMTQYSNDPAGSVLCLTEFGGNIEHISNYKTILIPKRIK